MKKVIIFEIVIIVRCTNEITSPIKLYLSLSFYLFLKFELVILHEMF